MDTLLLRNDMASVGDITSSKCLDAKVGCLDKPLERLCESLGMVEDRLVSVSCLPTMPAKHIGLGRSFL